MPTDNFHAEEDYTRKLGLNDEINKSENRMCCSRRKLKKFFWF